MAFGDFYRYEEQAVVLKQGVYDVELLRIFETNISNYRVLKFKFRVVGTPYKTSPGDFVLFDVSDPQDPEKLSMFIRKASKIKECFILKGPFCEANYVGWQGHKGKILVSIDKSGYANVSDFYPNEKLTDDDKAML